MGFTDKIKAWLGMDQPRPTPDADGQIRTSRANPATDDVPKPPPVVTPQPQVPIDPATGQPHFEHHREDPTGNEQYRDPDPGPPEPPVREY